MTKAPDRASGFVEDLGDAVKRNPLPAALVGMGIMWLFSNRSPIADAGSEVARNFGRGAGALISSAANDVQDSFSTASQAAKQSIDAVTEGGSRMSDAVSTRLEPVPAMVADAFDNIRNNLSETFVRQPLALGMLGLAVGAAVAASMPVTETENEYLGETSDSVKSKASEMFEEKSQQAVELGTKVVDAVADEAQKQGLTPSQLRSAASELKNKVARLGDAAQGTPTGSAH
jgi:hypothetical protein